MKSQFYIIIVLLVMLSLPQMLSAQTLGEQLLGTWTFDYQASLNDRTQSSVAHMNTMDTARKNKITATYSNRKVTFNTDGSFFQQLADGRTTMATWAVDNANLVVTAPNGRTLQFQIKAIQPNRLTLGQINTSGSTMNILFTNWHLTKN